MSRNPGDPELSSGRSLKFGKADGPSFISSPIDFLGAKGVDSSSAKLLGEGGENAALGFGVIGCDRSSALALLAVWVEARETADPEVRICLPPTPSICTRPRRLDPDESVLFDPDGLTVLVFICVADRIILVACRLIPLFPDPSSLGHPSFHGFSAYLRTVGPEIIDRCESSSESDSNSIPRPDRVRIVCRPWPVWLGG